MVAHIVAAPFVAAHSPLDEDDSALVGETVGYSSHNPAPYTVATSGLVAVVVAVVVVVVAVVAANLAATATVVVAVAAAAATASSAHRLSPGAHSSPLALSAALPVGSTASMPVQRLSRWPRDFPFVSFPRPAFDSPFPRFYRALAL